MTTPPNSKWLGCDDPNTARKKLSNFSILRKFWKVSKKQQQQLQQKTQQPNIYRTLHFYNLIWAVCHLFPQQRWRTHTHSVKGNHWPGEPRDLRKTMSARKFSSCVWSHLQDAYFFKYVVFKHPFSLLPIFFAVATYSLQCESTGVKSNNVDGPRRHSKYSLTMRLVPVSEKLPVSNHKKKDILNMLSFCSSCVSNTTTYIYTHTIILLIELVIFLCINVNFIIIYKFVLFIALF